MKVQYTMSDADMMLMYINEGYAELAARYAIKLYRSVRRAR